MNEYDEMLENDEQFDIILLKEFGGKTYGDVMVVNRGLYNTLIDRKIGMSVVDYQGVEDKRKLAVTAQNLEKELEKSEQDYTMIAHENEDLKDAIEIMKEKIKVLEGCKDKRTKKRKPDNKMIDINMIDIK